MGSEMCIRDRFKLPFENDYRVKRITAECIDWERMMRDLVNGILGKLGSFADEWYFVFGKIEDQILVSSPGLERTDCEHNDFATIQRIISRKLKVFPMYEFFEITHWKAFQNIVERGGYDKVPKREISKEIAEEAQMNGGYSSHQLFGKFPYLQYECDWTVVRAPLAELLALHRNGKYILPEKRLNFQNLVYIEDDEIERELDKMKRRE